MSRSFRHSHYHGLCADSEKDDKVRYHRKMHVRDRQVISRAMARGDLENIWLPLPNEVVNLYNWSKDGKFWFDPEEIGPIHKGRPKWDCRKLKRK